MSEHWIHVNGWERHQHRDAARSNTPPWIKNWTKLLHDDAYLELTAHQRAVLHGLWLIYASSRRQVRVNTASLTRQLNLRVSSRQLEALNHAGFIRFSASKDASLDVEEKRVEPQATPVAESLEIEVNGNKSEAQSLVAYFIDSSRALGSEPPGRVRGQVARLIGELVAEATATERISAGIDLMLAKRLHPSTLPSCVQEAGLPRNGNAGRNGLTAEQIVLQAQMEVSP